MNRLWYGDNLTIMREMPKHSVDLIYLDPPFKSDANYNLLYRNMTGQPVPEQAEAFFDTWELDAHKQQAAKAMPRMMREEGLEPAVVQLWQTWVTALECTNPTLLAYLIYMVERLIWMRGLLRPTGSIFLHCDPTASHYIKVMMDGIFGHENFRNEIVWKRTSAHSDAKTKFPAVSDVILFYAASKASRFKPVHTAHDPDYVDKAYRFDDGDGRGRYRLDNMAAPKGGGMAAINKTTGLPNGWYHYKGYEPPNTGWRYSPETMKRLDNEGRIHFPRHKDGTFDTSKRLSLKRYLAEQKGAIVTNVWTDIAPVQSRGSLGYPTQKPVALLERILSAASEPNNIVFDPFCGCGTTIYAAERLGRRWIGCDIAILAIKLVAQVLGETYRRVEGEDFVLAGVPVSVEQAKHLAEKDKFQFQHWFVERIGGYPMARKVADRGIDGRLYFEAGTEIRQVILSVKGGKLKPADVRDLYGVVTREQAPMGALLSLDEPTKGMRQEAASAGVFSYGGVDYPRLQLLSVADVLEGKRMLHTPTRMASRTTTGQMSLGL